MTSLYASAPTSPSRLLHQSDINSDANGMFFYSVPTSPDRGELLDPIFDVEGGSTDSNSPTTTTLDESEDDDFTLDDFEFETSHQFNVLNNDFDLKTSQEHDVISDHHEKRKRYQKQRHMSLPAIAFADELFCDGKVMPLNPPPCQQYSNGNDDGISRKQTPIPTATSASSATSSSGTYFKIPYPRRNLWNDDFDPFMAALENVKEDKKTSYHRRAWSMLPLRACTQPEEFAGFEHEHKDCLHSNPNILSPNHQIRPDGLPTPTWKSHPYQKTVNDRLRSSIKLAEPKGVVFARSVRMVKMGYKGTRNPTTAHIPEPVIQPEDNAGLSFRNSTTESKWHRIMPSFGLGIRSMKRTTEDEKKQGDDDHQTVVEFSRPKLLKKLTFRSKKLVESNDDEEKKQQQEVPQMRKMTIVRYRPKLQKILCLGYGANYSK